MTGRNVKIRRTQEWNAPQLPAQLKAAAQNSHKSIAQICREAGISTAFWYQLAKGNQASITYETLLALCKALEINIELFTVNDSAL